MLEKLSLDNDKMMRVWDQFVNSHPNGTPFHLSFWFRTIQKTYSFKPILYVKRDAKGVITGVAPFFLINSLFIGSRLVSLPFSDYGGPLFEDKIQEREWLREIIKEHSGRVKYIEIRNPVPDDCGYVCHNYYKGHVLHLEKDLSIIKKNINKRTIQYSIRKAEKAGVKVREENSKLGIDEFYRLNQLTRKKHGVPSQPKKFFDNLYDNIIDRGQGFILLGEFNSKSIAASLFLKRGDQIYFKYNASDPEYLKKVPANHLITWSAIEKGVGEGCSSLDFGRTSPDNKGLMRYKEMWGTETIDLAYNYYPQIKGTSSTEESGLAYLMATSLWRSLPDLFIKKLGPVIYKHMA